MKGLICSECGKENSMDSLYCENCGAKLVSKNVANDSERTNVPKKKTNQSKDSSKRIIAICLLCLLVIAAVFAVIFLSNRTEDNSNVDTETAVATEQDKYSRPETTLSLTTSIWNPDNEITESNQDNEIIEPKKTVLSAYSTSTLGDQAGFNYAADNIIDADTSTCWAEGVDGSGIGEIIEIGSNKTLEFNTIIINNGYCKSERLFNENNRAKKLRLTFDDGESVILNLKDGYSNFKNSFDMPKVKTKSITIEIVDVYKGSKWDDTCISDIIFS